MKPTILITGLICSIVANAFCDDTNIFARMGAPTNEFAVLSDYQSSLDDEALAESLQIKHWNFQLQISNNWASYSMDFLWRENGTIHELGHGETSISDIDPQTGRQTPGMFRDKILLMISPVDSTTEDSWRNSAKLRVFVKNSRSYGSFFIENPFKKNKETWATYGDASLIAKSPSKIEFNLMTAGTNAEFRVAFNPGVHVTFKNNVVP